MKFKVGDKVIAARESSKWQGAVGVVVSLDRERRIRTGGDDYLVTVKVDIIPHPDLSKTYAENGVQFYQEDCDLIAPVYQKQELIETYEVD